MQLSNRDIPGASLVHNERLPVCSGLVLLAGLWAASAAAQELPVMIDASPCLLFETSVERLVCFEEQVNAAAGNVPAAGQSNRPVLHIERSGQPAAPARTASAPSVAESANEPTAAATTPRTESSAAAMPQGPQAGFGLPRQNEDDDKANHELLGTIASLRKLAPDQYVITLTNGQVWRQMRPMRYNIQEGHDVRIYPTRWGSAYRLTVDKLKGFIQVERIR